MNEPPVKIMKAQYQQILHRCALNDMASARLDAKRPDRKCAGYGNLLITDTTEGVLDLRYHPSTRSYSILNFNTGTSIWIQISAGRMAAYLASVYNVTLSNTVVELG